MAITTFDHGGTVFATARRLGLRPADLLDFSASINPLGLPESVREQVTQGLDDLTHYPDSDCALFIESLASFHQVEKSSICPGNGSTELIYLLPRLIRGKKALVVAPPFSEYARALIKGGWEVDYFHLSATDGFALDPAAVAGLLPGVDLLVVANPGNPTGALYPQPVMTELLRLAGKSETFVVIDEAFIDWTEHESMKWVVTTTPSAIVLRSLTKFFGMPGLRAGFAIGHPDIIGRMRELREPWSIGTLAQVAGAAAVRDGDYMKRSLAFVAEERDYLRDRLENPASFTVFPSAANFLLVRINGPMTATEVRDRLLEERILIRDCSSFAGLDDSYFRVAVRTRAENEALLEGLRKVVLL